MTIAEATMKALSLRNFLWRARRKDIFNSADFILGVTLGIVSTLLSFVHRSPAPPYTFTIIVSTFAIIGGFLGTSLSILIGFISKPASEVDRMQFLKVIADYCYSVAVVFATALAWIGYAIFITMDRTRTDVSREIVRSLLLFVSSYAAMIPFSALNRLFTLAGIATIAEEKAKPDSDVAELGESPDYS
jgi:hypothetical protein